VKVLFADDHEETADSLAMRAQSLGHEAMTAYDGATALALACECAFDLILLDIHLGDGDGRKVCSEIRREGLSRHAHIVAATGHIGLERQLNLGDFNGYMLKPIEFDRLEDLLVS
jgi:CheY-like chemotaxis protein